MKNYKIIICLLLSFFIGFFSVKNYASAKNINSKLIANKELDKVLKLKLKIFLGANDLKNALRICNEGVEYFPKDYYWQEWAGNISMWSGNTFAAVNYYYKAFILSGKKSLAEKTYKLSTAFHRWDMAERIIEMQGNSVNLKDTVYVYQMAGNPDKLINLLRKLYKEKKSKKVLNYLIYTYWEKGDIRRTLKTFLKLKRNFGLNTKETMEYANVLLAEKNYTGALGILKAHRLKARKLSYKFWRKLSDLAWMLGYYKTAVRASMVLAGLKPVLLSVTKEDANGRFYKTEVNFIPARNRDYERIYSYYSESDPEVAMKYALNGWKIYHTPYLFDGFIYLDAKQKMWKNILKKVSKLNKNEYNAIFNNVYFVLTYANALEKTGQVQKAKKLCLARLKKNFNPDFLSELIYLSLNSGDNETLNYIIKKWGDSPRNYPVLAPSFISLYVYLEKGQKALKLSKELTENPSLNNELLYADILSLYGNSNEAKDIRFKAWKKMKKELKNNPLLIDNAQFLENFLSTSMRFDNIKNFNKILTFSKKILPAVTFEDFKLSYELFRNYRSKAVYMHRKYGYNLKPWMLLDISLYNNDTYLQKKLLKEWADILPIRDRVEAFRDTGNIGEAFDYAFKGLEENRNDYLLYKQFRDLADKYANRARISNEFIDWEGYREILENIYLKYNIGSGYSLIPSVQAGKEISFDNATIVNVPYKHYNAGLTLEKQYGGNCDFKSSAGIISSLENNIYFLIEPNCKINNSTRLGFLYGEHIQDNETLFLYLGGLKRELKTELYHSINMRTDFSASVSQNWFLSQDNQSLGSGNNLYAEFSYKPMVDYSDFTLRTFMQSAHFYENGNAGDIAQLSPFSNFDAIPSSYNLIGAGFSIGDKYKDKLEKTWRPFLNGDIFYETDSGFGYDAGAGYGGSILGNDNFNLGVSYYTDFQGTSASYLELFINYNIFF